MASGAAMFKNYAYNPASPTGRHGFEIHGLDISIVNGLRRVILTDIPTLGFSGEEEPSVEISENTGPLHNEIMSHRIGCLPVFFSEEETDAFTADSWSFDLSAKNTGDSKINVTSQFFKVKKNDRAFTETEVRRLFPVNAVSQEPVLITRLRPGEELVLRATPVKQTARFHASFCPVSMCTFQYLVDPAKAANITDPLEKERAFTRNAHGEAAGVLFELEPEVALGPKYLISKALDIMIQKVSGIPAALYLSGSAASAETATAAVGVAAAAAAGVAAAEMGSKVTVAPAATAGVEFTFQDEDDTLGNLLQSYLHQRYVREKANAPNGDVVTYAGYFCPHPLDPSMVLRLVLGADVNVAGEGTVAEPVLSSYIEVVSDACRALQIQLQQIQNEWLRFAP